MRNELWNKNNKREKFCYLTKDILMLLFRLFFFFLYSNHNALNCMQSSYKLMKTLNIVCPGKGLPRSLKILESTGISYFHDHAQCVIHTLLVSHRSCKYHAFRDKSFFFLFSRSFRHRVQGLFPIIL